MDTKSARRSSSSSATLTAAARLDGVGIEIGIARDHLHGEQAAAEFGHAAADIAEADDADGTALHVIAHEGGAVAHGAAPQGVIGLDDLLREHEHHRDHMRRHRLGVAAGLIDHEHAGLGAVLDVDGVVAGAAGGHHEQVRHARQQVALGVKARTQLVAGRPDLIGMRGGDDRLDGFVGCLVLELVDPDFRPLRHEVEITGMRHLAHVEYALHVFLHVAEVLDSNLMLA